jgi:hypothetical protein
LQGHVACALQLRFAVEMGPATGDVGAGWLESASANSRKAEQRKVHFMLYTIAVVLLILWLLGLVTSYTVGGFIHIFLVVAIILILFNLISGRRAL